MKWRNVFAVAFLLIAVSPGYVQEKKKPDDAKGQEEKMQEKDERGMMRQGEMPPVCM